LVTARRFPPPWAVEDIGGCFVVKASNDRPLVFIYYGEGVARRSLARLLTRDAARRSADRCRARYDDKCDGKQTYLEPSRFFGSFFLFQRFSLLRHRPPTVRQNRGTFLEARRRSLQQRYADTRRPFAGIRQHGSASWWIVPQAAY
jgi:hypothetical protein